MTYKIAFLKYKKFKKLNFWPHQSPSGVWYKPELFNLCKYNSIKIQKNNQCFYSSQTFAVTIFRIHIFITAWLDLPLTLAINEVYLKTILVFISEITATDIVIQFLKATY